MPAPRTVHEGKEYVGRSVKKLFLDETEQKPRLYSGVVTRCWLHPQDGICYNVL
jgi:hypothetical protein